MLSFKKHNNTQNAKYYVAGTLKFVKFFRTYEMTQQKVSWLLILILSQRIKLTKLMFKLSDVTIGLLISLGWFISTCAAIIVTKLHDHFHVTCFMVDTHRDNLNNAMSFRRGLFPCRHWLL